MAADGSLTRYELKKTSGPFLGFSDLIFLVIIAGTLFSGSYLLGGLFAVVGAGLVLSRIANNGYVGVTQDNIVLRSQVIGTIPLMDVERVYEQTWDSPPSLITRVLGIDTERMAPTVGLRMKRRRLLFTTAGFFLPTYTRYVGLSIAVDRVSDFIAEVTERSSA